MQPPWGQCLSGALQNSSTWWLISDYSTNFHRLTFSSMSHDYQNPIYPKLITFLLGSYRSSSTAGTCPKYHCTIIGFSRYFFNSMSRRHADIWSDPGHNRLDFLTLPWGQGKICPTSVAWWLWPNVIEMGTKWISRTYWLTTCSLKKLAPGVFPESLKVLAERWRQRRQRRQRRRKWTKTISLPVTQGEISQNENQTTQTILQWWILKLSQCFELQNPHVQQSSSIISSTSI